MNNWNNLTGTALKKCIYQDCGPLPNAMIDREKLQEWRKCYSTASAVCQSKSAARLPLNPSSISDNGNQSPTPKEDKIPIDLEKNRNDGKTEGNSTVSGMSMNKKIMIGAGAVVVVGLGIWAYYKFIKK